MTTHALLRTGTALGTLLFIAQAGAHAPLFACVKKENTVRCEAGYSDGSSAAGRPVTVVDENHQVLIEAQVAENGTYEFAAPAGTFHVVFDGGQYHEVTVYSSDIEVDE